MRRTVLMRLEHELRGKKLSQAQRSIGSVLLLDFGTLCEHGTSTGGNILWRGQLALMIELAAWRIRSRGRVLATNCSKPSDIDRIPPQLVGARIQQAHFSATDSYTGLQGGLSVALCSDESVYGDQSQYSESWILFRNGINVLWCDRV